MNYSDKKPPFPLFQFHSGSIRRRPRGGNWPNMFGFNSIVVRLEAPFERALADFVRVFQFHSGSIRSKFKKSADSGRLSVSIP